MQIGSNSIIPSRDEADYSANDHALSDDTGFGGGGHVLPPTLTEILRRVSLNQLKELAGQSSVALLNTLKPHAVSQPGLADFLAHRAGEASALLDPNIRAAAIAHLDISEAKEICSALGLPTADPVATLLDAVKNPARLERLLRYLSLPLSLSFSEAPAASTKRAAPAGLLRPHQTDGYRRLRRALNLPDTKVLLHMPYGAGKLRMVAVTVADAFRSEPDDKTILWFASGEQLCDDAFNELVSAWEAIGTRPVTVTRAYGKHQLPDIANVVSGIYVFDIEEFVSEVSGCHPDLPTMVARSAAVVLHDASLIAIPAIGELIEAMDGAGDLRVVGICATEQGGLAAIGRSAFLKYFNVSISIEADAPIRVLRDANEIDALELELVASPETTVPPRIGDIDVEVGEHERLAQDMARNANLIERIVSEIGDMGNVVFFASTAEQARTFSGVLSFYGSTAITVTSEMSPDVRLQEIRRFQQQDESQVLCVHDVLISGKDVPKITSVVISTPIISAMRLSETFGRLASGRSSTSGSLRLIVVDDGIPGYSELVQATTHWSETVK